LLSHWQRLTCAAEQQCGSRQSTL